MKVVVKSEYIRISSVSINVPGLLIPSWSMARDKIVYLKLGPFRWKIRRYIVFTHMIQIEETTGPLDPFKSKFEYKTNYIRVK